MVRSEQAAVRYQERAQRVGERWKLTHGAVVPVLVEKVAAWKLLLCFPQLPKNVFVITHLILLNQKLNQAYPIKRIISRTLAEGYTIIGPPIPPVPFQSYAAPHSASSA